MLASGVFVLSILGIAQNQRMQLTQLPPFPIKLQSRFSKLPTRQPSAQKKLDTAALKLLRLAIEMKPGEDLASKARETSITPFAGQISASNSGDIEALAFIVLMQATKAMDEDLKQIMESAKEIAQEKENLRKQKEEVEQLKLKFDKKPQGRIIRDRVKPAPMEYKATKHNLARIPILGPPSTLPNTVTTMSFNDLRDQTDKIKDKMDSMSELGEMESLRLQMLMDRRSKFIETLSNILRKMSDTSSAIISNLK